MTHMTTVGMGRRARRPVAAGLLAACAFAGFAVGGASPAHAISPCQNPDLIRVPPWCSKVPGAGAARTNAQTASAARTHIVLNRTH